MKRAFRRGAVLSAVIALAVAGCGRGGTGSTDDVPGVTAEPCPKAIDKDKGCIYLGVISDMTGPFKGVGVPLTAGGAAFWQRVNKDGGIGDYEVDVTTYAKDNKYDAETHAQAFSEIKDNVLGMAQSLGMAPTEAMLKDADAKDLAVVPATLGSNWYSEDRVLELGTSYCGDAINSVDYAVDTLGAKKVLVVHFPGDYGDDVMVGARDAAEGRGIGFSEVQTGPGADQQAAAVKAVVGSGADVVLVGTGPLELASIVGGSVQSGFSGKFIGAGPSWNAALLKSPAGPALESSYLWGSGLRYWDTDSPGYDAMRAANGETPPNDYYALGWASGYIMKAALEKAVDDGQVTRAGLLKAATSLTSVDSEGMLADGVGNYAGDANEAAVRLTHFGAPDSSSSTGIKEVAPFAEGASVKKQDFSKPCYLRK